MNSNFQVWPQSLDQTEVWALTGSFEHFQALGFDNMLRAIVLLERKPPSQFHVNTIVCVLFHK